MTADGRPIIWSPQPGPQTALLTCPIADIFYGGARGGGKGLRPSALVSTPYGFCEVGALVVGDVVSSSDGGEQTVLGVYDRGEQDFYRFRFVDGAEVDVDADHLWMTRRTLSPSKLRRKARLRGEDIDSLSQTRLMRTSEIVEWFARKKTHGGPKVSQQNLLVPLCGPVRFAAGLRSGSRPLEPYLLGVLIGDGCVSRDTPAVTSADPEIMAHVAEMGYELSEHTYPGRPPMYSFIGKTAKLLRESLSEMGLLGKHSWEKSVPEAYLYASVDERWELLRGL